MGFLENLSATFGSFIDRHRTLFDPELLGDPLAMQVEWSPMANGGTNFSTHRLKAVSPVRLELRPTLFAWFFGGTFASVGVFSFLFMIPLAKDMGTRDPRILIPLLFAIPFGAVGYWVLKRMTVRHVFDKSEGFCWSGSVSPSEDLGLVQNGKAFALSDIRAIQLIGELVRGNKGGTFKSVEINLVLQDGSRRHIVDHGGKGIHQDAQQLASFLGVPVWDKDAARRPFDPSRDQSVSEALSRRFRS